MQSVRLWFPAIALLLSSAGTGQEPGRFVVLPGSEASDIQIRSAAGKFRRPKGSWEMTKADIEGLEANLPELSKLGAQNWPSHERIDHPEKYYRQYIPIILDKQKLIYINAYCSDPPTNWKTNIFIIFDGGTCVWQATYDPAAKKFIGLTINGDA